VRLALRRASLRFGDAAGAAATVAAAAADFTLPPPLPLLLLHAENAGTVQP
jgi:hypothetical protein